YEGTWEKYHFGTIFGVEGSKGNEFLKLAAEAAEILIDNDNLNLYSTGNPNSDYFDLFSMNTLKNISEAILFEAVEPSLQLGSNNWTHLNGQRGGGTGVTKNLIESYLCTDGLPIDISPMYL